MASEPKDIPAAIDPAITGPRGQESSLHEIPVYTRSGMMFVSIGADGTPSYTIQTLGDWIARVKARGHAMLEEKQLKFQICVARRGI